MNHRDLVRRVRKRLSEFGMKPFQLHQKLADKVSKQTVYNFVEHGRVIKSDTLLIIMGGASTRHCQSTNQTP